MSIRDILDEPQIIFESYNVSPDILNLAVSLFKVIDTAIEYKNLQDIGNSISHLEINYA